MKVYSTTFYIFLNILLGCGQSKVPVIGTRLILELPSEFKEDRTVPGFRSKIDSSTIYVVEVDNPYSFEELIHKRISKLLSLGIDTSNYKDSMYDGYKSVQFNTFNPLSNEKGFTLNFGSDDFLIDISIITSNNRFNELEKIIMHGKYNKHLDIDYETLLGFTASYEGTNQHVFKKDANTINTRENDELGNIHSWLNLTRMPKSTFEGLSLENSINAMYSLYSFDMELVETDSLIIDNSKLLWNVYMKDFKAFQEYKIIGIIPNKEFDLLIMGGVNNKEKLTEIYKVINSIKFKNSW